MSKTVLLIPRVSEKSYDLSQKKSVYVFEVPKSANKLTIRDSVTEQFKVTVLNVRVAHLPAKPKRTVVDKGRKIYKGHQPGVKKAYVTLKEGDKIPIFGAEEDKKKDKTEKSKARGAK